MTTPTQTGTPGTDTGQQGTGQPGQQQPANTNPQQPPASGSGTGSSGGVDQSEVDKWKALARKHEQTAKANADAATRLAKLEQDQMTEQQKLEARAKDADDKALKAEARAARAELAVELELPKKWADRIPIGTPDEMRAAATELKKDLDEMRGGAQGGAQGGAPAQNGRRPTAADLRQGARPNAPQSLTADDAIRRMAGYG